MSLYSFLITASTIAGALYVIFRFGKIIAKPIINAVDLIKDMQADIQELKESSHDNRMDCLKLIIMSAEMPIEERLGAGDRYIKRGGNGAIKAKYNVLKKEYEENEEKGEK